MKIIRISTLTGSLLLMLFSFAHLFTGYPAINEMILNDQPSDDLARTFRVIWIFSFIAMFVTGVWGIRIYFSLRRDYLPVSVDCMALGLAYLFFGVYGLLQNFPNWHLSLFAVPGILFFIPGVILMLGRANKS